MKALIVTYGIVVLISFGLMTFKPEYLGNVGFLVVGVIISIYAAVFIEAYKQHHEKKNMTAAVFHELANRVARCCFDFEHPWKAYYLSPQHMVISRLERFSPNSPIIYPAVAEKIATFRSDAVQGIMLFYVFLAAWERDIESTANECKRQGRPVRPEDVRRLARRLRTTLKPGHDILEKLSSQISNAGQIELDAIAELDQLFLKDHPNAGKPLRERIRIALSETEAKEE